LYDTSITIILYFSKKIRVICEKKYIRFYEGDIGVTIDQHLNFEKHIQTEINKANQIVGLTRRSFVHLDNRTFSLSNLDVDLS
jgi:hypothetical protein